MPYRANIELDTMHPPDTYRMTPYGFAQTAEPRQFVVTYSWQVAQEYQTLQAAATPNITIPPNWMALPPAWGEPICLPPAWGEPVVLSAASGERAYPLPHIPEWSDPPAVERLIDLVVKSTEGFEDSEPRPSQSAIRSAKQLVQSAYLALRHILKPEVSAYYGELNLTWRFRNRLVRLITFSDNRVPVVYWLTEGPELLSRGESRSVQSPEDLNERLTWLLGG